MSDNIVVFAVQGLVLWFYLRVNYWLKLNLLVDRHMMARWKKSCTLLFNKHQPVFLIVLSVAIYLPRWLSPLPSQTIMQHGMN
jgi:hypothetical protein